MVGNEWPNQREDLKIGIAASLGGWRTDKR